MKADGVSPPAGSRDMSKSKPVEPGEEAPDKPDLCTILNEHPAAEDQFGGGDICSPEEEPPTDDDKPLD
jgi:hypothetical protein